KSVVEQKGIGLKNFWTFDAATPRGTQKDFVLNTADPVQAINPLFISGSTDSWITELIWDRLLRVGPDGLPRPWAAEKVEWVDSIPKHIWEPVLADLAKKPENAESYQEQVPVGSGPYKFVQWKKAEEVVLEANPDHFAAPKARRWVLRIIPNVEAALGGLRNG